VAELPSGTVTFLFTDVEGSTRLWEDHPDEMRVALERHDELVRAAIDDQGGRVFSTAGDSFAAAFAEAQAAVSAATAIQRGLGDGRVSSEVEIRVRIGIHRGEAVVRDGDYFGSPVNRAARLMSAAHGGQVVNRPGFHAGSWV